MNSKESFRALVGVIQEKIEELGSNNPSDEVEKLIKSKLEPFLESKAMSVKKNMRVYLRFWKA